MAGLKLKIVGKDIAFAKLDPKKVKGRVADAMDIVINDAASLLAEASPVGVYGNMQGAWLQTKGVDVDLKGNTTGFIDPQSVAPYTWYVINGRRPGKMPPPIELLPWVWKKLGVTGMKARAVAWNVARKIGRHGTKGNNFPAAIIRKNKKLWRSILAKAVHGDQ